MARQNIIIEQNFDDRTLPLTQKFAGLLAKKLAKSKIMELANFKTGLKIDAGSLIFAKAGADEDLESIYGEFTSKEMNDVSNIYDEIEIPFVIQASTKGIRLSPEEWLQTDEGMEMDEQALSVKADKTAKIIMRIVMELWFAGKAPNPAGGGELVLGDGAIPVINFEFKADLTDREAVAKEYDKFALEVMNPQIEKIRNIGFKDPITGKNATDAYRTGVPIEGYSIAVSSNIKTRWEIWASHYGYNNQALEEGSFGRTLGFSMYEDIALPFVGAKVNNLWVKKQKYAHATEKLTYVESERRIEFMFIKEDVLVKGVVLDYLWDERIPKSQAHVVGWNMRFGAGTKFVDEIFAIDTLTAVAPAKKQLSTVLKTTALGELADDVEATIKTAIDAKNPTAKGNYTLSALGQTGATATGTGEYEGTVDVTFTIKAKSKAKATA